MFEINETHDPNLKSWIESANAPDTDFPIQNLPFCAFEYPGNDGDYGIGVIIGDKVLDIYGCEEAGLFEEENFADALSMCFGDLNQLGYLDSLSLSELRRKVSKFLREDFIEQQKLINHLYSISDIKLMSPFRIGDYTDFYCSIFHATNVGAMFRPHNPLLPNYKYIPIGYHGRASSIVVSGTDVKRPKGQNRTDPDAPPVYIPAKNLDYEMEVGFFVGKPNQMGETIPIDDAEEHIFGLCLVNDWSARDIQAWEYQPLGPFLAKSFATTVSPFVVTMEALAPFRVPAFERDANDPQPLDYLNGETTRSLSSNPENARRKRRTFFIEPFKYEGFILDNRANADASRLERLQSKHGRFDGDRNGFRSRQRRARLLIGIDVARQRTDKSAERRRTQIFRRRRRNYYERLL